MATSNTQVTTYLPAHILEYVTKYCTQYGIVRKKDSKPILATGIVDLLNILVNIPIEDLTTAKTNIPSIDVESLIEKKLSDSKVISTLLDTLLDDMVLVERLKGVLVPSKTLKDDNTKKDTLPVNEEKNEKIVFPSKMTQFETIKAVLCQMNRILSIEEIATAFKCYIDQIETKEDLTDAQLKILQYLPSREDGKFDNNIFEIFIDKEEDITLKSTPSESPIMPLNDELGTTNPNDKPSPNNEDIEVVETEKDIDTDIDTGGDIGLKELTEAQQKVMTNLNKIPAGERLSYNKLADKLGVSRSVLDSFDLWQQEFTIEQKKRGCDYIKK